MNGRQFVYFMQGLTKSYPANRKVLENIHLQFYPDAKLGVLRANGAGNRRRSRGRHDGGL